MKLIALGLLLAANVATAADVLNPQPEFGPVVIFGDSLAKGYGSRTDDARLEACITRSFPGYEGVTYAALGATTSDAVKWVDGLLQLKPKAVIVSLGGNDVMQFGSSRVPAQTTFDNLRTIYKALVSQGIMVTHLGLNPPVLSKRLPEIRGVAESEGVLFVPDIMEGLWGDPRYMSNMIHPNDAGYKIVCQRVVRAMTPYMRQP